MEDREQNSGDEERGQRCEPPKQPERSEEQLAAIKAAMMEELGAGRKDTLPLEDRKFDSQASMSTALRRRRPVNAAVAQWQNAKFDDVEEADEHIDSIADGQLYRLRRTAIAGSSHTPSSRGGHSSSYMNRGGRGGSGISTRNLSDQGDHLTKGINQRASGDLCLAARGAPGKARSFAAISRGGIGHLTSSDARNSECTPAAFYNDASRGIRSHARVEQTIAMLKSPAQFNRPTNTTPGSSPKHTYTLSSPEAFQNFIDSSGPSRKAAQAALGPATTELKQISSETELQATTNTVNKTATMNSNRAHLNLSTATTVTNTAILPPYNPAPTPLLARPSTAVLAAASIFTNRSTGLLSSKWATSIPVSSPGLSLNASSFSDSNASIFNALAPALAPQDQDQVASTMTAPLNYTNELPRSPVGSVVQSRPAVSATASNASVPPDPAAPAPSVVDPFKVEPNSGVVADHATAMPDRNVIIEKLAMASRNGTDPVKVKIRLVQSLAWTVSLQIERDGVILYNEILRAKVSYQAPSVTMTFIDGLNVITVSFRFPHEAVSFEKHMRLHLENAPSFSKPTSPNIEPAVTVNDLMKETLVVDTGALSILPDTDMAKKIPADSDTLAIDEPIVASDGMLIDFTEDASRVLPPPLRGSSALDDLADIDVGKNPVVTNIFGKLNIAAASLSEEAILSAAENLATDFLQDHSLFNLLTEEQSTTYVKCIGRQVLKSYQEQSFENSSLQTSHEQTVDSYWQTNCQQHFNNTGQVRLDHGDPQEALSPLEKPCALQDGGCQQIRRYSVDGLVSLRGQGFIEKGKLSRAEKLSLSAKNPSYTPSKIELASISPGKSDDGLVQIIPISKPVAAKAETTDSAQVLFPTIANKLSQVPPAAQTKRSRHCPTPSDVEIRLSECFSALKLTSQAPVNTLPQAISQFAQTQVFVEDLRVEKAKVGLKASAQAFTPNYSTLQATAETGLNAPSSQAADHKSIISVSNNKEDMVKAKVPGLGASRWAVNAPAVFPVPRYQNMPTFYSVSQMQTTTGNDVTGTVPILARNMVSLPRIQENLPFHSITSFPQRRDMFNHRASNASSVSDIKPTVASVSVSSSTLAPRQPLSPQKATQALLNESLPKRQGSQR